MRTTPSVEALLAQAHKPAEDALRLHPVYGGKLEVTLKCPITDLADFAIWYSPGVAAPCRDIAQHPEKSRRHHPRLQVAGALIWWHQSGGYRHAQMLLYLGAAA